MNHPQTLLCSNLSRQAKMRTAGRIQSNLDPTESRAESRVGNVLKTGTHRVNRGGGFNNTARNCRSANRNANPPSNRNNNLGFRPQLPSKKIRRSAGDQGRFRTVRWKAPRGKSSLESPVSLGLLQDFQADESAKGLRARSYSLRHDVNSLSTRSPRSRQLRPQTNLA